MKKKLLAVLAAMTMMVTSAVTAFALPSTEALTVEIVSAIDKDGNDLTNAICHQIKLRPLQEKDRPSAEEVSAQSNLKIVLGDDYVEGLQVIHAADVYVWDVDEQKVIDWMDGADYHFPVTVTFKIPGVKAGDNVHVLHGYDGADGSETDGNIAVSEWHKELLVEVADGTISVQFAHLSPVLFLMERDSSDTQSPTTGENNIMLMAGLVAIVALAGVIVTRKSLKVTK